MRSTLTMEILTVIDYVQTQKKAFSILNNEILKTKKDYIEELREVYNNLPLPKEMDTSNGCFEAVLCYPLNDKIMNTESKDLPKNFIFGF